jgi:hypothetical protein
MVGLNTCRVQLLAAVINTEIIKLNIIHTEIIKVTLCPFKCKCSIGHMATFQFYWWRKTSGGLLYIISGRNRHLSKTTDVLLASWITSLYERIQNPCRERPLPLGQRHYLYTIIITQT